MRRRDFVACAGAALLAASRAYGQDGKTYRVAYLALTPGDDTGYKKVFVDRLRELGLVEGRNLTLVFRSADGDAQKLPALAAELVNGKPDVLVAGFGTLAAKAAKAATTSVPVVFATVGDPVGAGLVSNLRRPGGNVTGFSSLAVDIAGKRLQLFRELVPAAKRAAVLINPGTPFSALAVRELQSAAAASHIGLDVIEVRSGAEIAAAVARAAQSRPDGLIVFDDPLITSVRAELIRAVAAQRLPALFADRLVAEAGGLAAYGPDRRENFRRAAEYVEKILKGAAPGDLPVEQSSKFDLVLNARTAKAMGFELPTALVVRADDVIE